ncbi:MAG TPA: benzoate-CoA ligase family protein [Blastocatellia bacterium]|jgi:benzoate-CoA ligase|nr:benzoate-CoA ligase family protein [Blastocatellia bacterium]
MSVSFAKQFNMASYFLDDRIEEGRGENVAVYFEDKRYTYSEVQSMANQAGNALLSLGVEMEDRVLIVLPDSIEFVATWFGIAKIGAVIAMVNTILPTADYEYYLEYTRAKVAVVHFSVVERFAPAASHSALLKHTVVAGWEGSGSLEGLEGSSSLASYDRLTRGASDRLETAQTSRDDIAIWLFTSGSTGHPKAAVHLHHDLPYNTECYAKQVLDIHEDDITLSVPKLFFGYATGTNLLFPFAVGGAAALFSERSTPETIFEMIQRFRPTILTSVPTMINSMLQVEGARNRYDLSSLRFCLSAGEALPPELYNRWVDTFGVEILDGIGSAEMFHIYISNYPGDVVPGSLGRIVPGYEARIVDADGREVASGEMGTLMIKGDSAALCYWNAHEKSKATFAGDWCTSGDQFRVDERGYYWYCGRTDEMLKVSGIYVSPTEIENCLLEHEAVRECAVVGASDGQGLIKPKAFVVTAAGIEGTVELERELKEFVKAKLAAYKYPRSIEFRDDLPKNDRGKIDRKALKP